MQDSPFHTLLQLSGKSIVDRAQVEPFLLDDLGLGAGDLLLRCLSKHDSKSCLQVPI